MAGKTITVDGFIKQFGLDEETSAALLAGIPLGGAATDPFVFDLPTFESIVPLLSIELDNGSIITAPAEKFEECFKCETVNAAEKRVRFSTTGKITDQRLKGRSK